MKRERKHNRKILFLLMGLLLWYMTPLVSALDDDAYDGYAADTLTIEVGYFGGPYYEKRVFTTEELWNLPLVREDYTFIDNMPSVVIDHVVGVRLDDLMAEAGIDVNSIETFRFWTVDKTSDYYTQYPKNELLDTTRYCYYSLPDNFDSENGVGLDGADAIGVNCSLGPVETAPIAHAMLDIAACPVIVQANAGLPSMRDGEVSYSIAAPEYAQAVDALLARGVSIVGGCCGTTPDYIGLLASLVADRKPTARM